MSGIEAAMDIGEAGGEDGGKGVWRLLGGSSDMDGSVKAVGDA